MTIVAGHRRSLRVTATCVRYGWLVTEPQRHVSPRTPIQGVPVVLPANPTQPIPAQPSPTQVLPAQARAGAEPSQLALPLSDDEWTPGFDPVPGAYGGGEQVTRAPRARVRVGPRLSALAAAVVAAVALAATTHFFLRTVAGQRLDESALEGADYGQGTLWRLAEPVLDVVSVSFVIIAMGAAMLVALMRRRWGLGLQVAFLVAGANVTTQLLKHRVLERPDLDVWTQRPENSLPSGHTTVAASVSMALLIAVPRRMRPLVALIGAAYTGATGVATMVGQWHRPGDVIAAILVVAVWTCLVLALTPSSGVDRDGHGGVISTTVAGTLLGAGAVISGLAAYAMLVSKVRLIGAADVHTQDYIGTAFTVVAMTCLMVWVVLLLRQATAQAAQHARR